MIPIRCAAIKRPYVPLHTKLNRYSMRNAVILNVIQTNDAFDLEIPAINVYMAHMIGSNTHNTLVSVEQIVEMIAQMKMFQSKNYSLILSGYDILRTIKVAAEKIAYSEKTKQIVASSNSADEFITAMNKAFPAYYGGDFLGMSAGAMFAEQSQQTIPSNVVVKEIGNVKLHSFMSASVSPIISDFSGDSEENTPLFKNYVDREIGAWMIKMPDLKAAYVDHLGYVNLHVLIPPLQPRLEHLKALDKEAGFDMVLIHGGHGWLLGQFSSPSMNRRTDKWSGSLENRMHFSLLVIEKVREGIEIAKMIDGKVDIIHVSASIHENLEVFTLTHPSMLVEHGYNVHLEAEIKKHVKMPVATLGGLNAPDMMEEIIASGKADIIQLARQSFCNPYFPEKAFSGNADDINRCCRCYTCFYNYLTNRTFCCAFNPVVGNEMDHKYAYPTTTPKKVIVISGGPGGMGVNVPKFGLGAAVTGSILASREDGKPIGKAVVEGLVPPLKLLGTAAVIGFIGAAIKYFMG